MCLCFSRLQDVLTDLKHKYEKQEKGYRLSLSSVHLSVWTSVVCLSICLSHYVPCQCRLHDVLTNLKRKYEKQEKRYHLCLSSVCLSATLCAVSL